MLIHTLKKTLTQGPVPLTYHRIDLISRLVCALIQVRSVKMKKLACSLSGLAKIDSPYRRLQRFLAARAIGVHLVDRIEADCTRLTPSVGLGPDALEVRTHRSESIVFRTGLPRRVYSIGISVVTKAEELQYRGTQTHPNPSLDLPRCQLVLSSRRS